MNQILATKPAKQVKTVKTTTVKTFFAISIIIFGICMATSGSYAMFKGKVASENNNNQSQTNPQIPNSNNENIQISLSNEESIIHATVIGKSEIAFVTYRWDDEEETKIEINNISDDVEIDIPGGEHTLTVTAVDVDNTSKTLKKKVKGITKPTLEVIQEGSQFVINASDDIGLEKITFILNGQGYLIRAEGVKEKEFRYNFEEGDNTLEVTAYNVEGITETYSLVYHN